MRPESSCGAHDLAGSSVSRPPGRPVGGGEGQIPKVLRRECYITGPALWALNGVYGGGVAAHSGAMLALTRRALLACLFALGAAHAEPHAGWLEIEEPRLRESSVGEPVVEVRGRAGGRGGSIHDLIIAIDVSDSTTRPSGIDLDGDGPDGRTARAALARLEANPDVSRLLVKRLRDIDFEDSVLAAELLAAEVLIGRLDARRFRVGIVAFSDAARVVAPLGSDRNALRRGLAALGDGFHEYLRGTNFAAAIRLAHLQLIPDRNPGSRRERSILLLSDGAPTLPVAAGGPELATYSAAARAAADGIRIYAFALGPAAEDGLPVYREIADLSGGRLEQIEQPADAIARLRRLDLADLESIEITNLTTAVPARATRQFPDGSFDGFVSLGEGANRILFEARASDGAVARAERSIVYDPALGIDEAALRALLEELRRRTRELELWAEVERGRDEQLRQLTLEPGFP